MTILNMCVGYNIARHHNLSFTNKHRAILANMQKLEKVWTNPFALKYVHVSHLAIEHFGLFWFLCRVFVVVF